MAPSTKVHVPFAVAVLPLTKNLQPEHFLPPFGLLWYLNCACEPLADAIDVFATNSIAPTSGTVALRTKSRRV